MCVRPVIMATAPFVFMVRLYYALQRVQTCNLRTYEVPIVDFRKARLQSLLISIRCCGPEGS